MNTALALSLGGTALLLSICALLVAWSTSDRSLAKRYSELSTRCSDLEQSLESLTGQMRNLKARANMQAFRGRKAAASSDHDQSDDADQADGRDWVRRMNERLAQGRLGLHGGGK